MFWRFILEHSIPLYSGLNHSRHPKRRRVVSNVSQKDAECPYLFAESQGATRQLVYIGCCIQQATRHNGSCENRLTGIIYENLFDIKNFFQFQLKRTQKRLAGH